MDSEMTPGRVAWSKYRALADDPERLAPWDDRWERVAAAVLANASPAGGDGTPWLRIDLDPGSGRRAAIWDVAGPEQILVIPGAPGRAEHAITVTRLAAAPVPEDPDDEPRCPGCRMPARYCCDPGCPHAAAHGCQNCRRRGDRRTAHRDDLARARELLDLPGDLAVAHRIAAARVHVMLEQTRIMQAEEDRLADRERRLVTPLLRAGEVRTDRWPLDGACRFCGVRGQDIPGEEMRALEQGGWRCDDREACGRRIDAGTRPQRCPHHPDAARHHNGGGDYCGECGVPLAPDGGPDDDGDDLPWPPWLEGLTFRERAGKIVAAVFLCAASDHRGAEISRDQHCTPAMAEKFLVKAAEAITLPNLSWAPYREFGIPDRADESPQAPAGPVTIGAVGYRGQDIIVYWQPPDADGQLVTVDRDDLRAVLAAPYVDGALAADETEAIQRLRVTLESGIVPGHRAMRSTPGEYADCAVMTDTRGKQWKYSVPSDTWCLVTGEHGPGSISLSSARSWQRLSSEFGPLFAVTGDDGPV